MVAVDPISGTAPPHLLCSVRALCPEIESRAAEIEANRQLPNDLVDALRRCGVFRMFTPASHGGLETAIPVALEALSELAAADGAVGWSAMIGSVGPIIFAGLPRSTFDAIYATPDLIQAGSTVPAGKAERVPGGYRVTGRWPFASGCRHAEWMCGVCAVVENGEPVVAASGQGQAMRLIFGPADEWRIEDTWRASGLRGTGSHHISLADHFVAQDFTSDWLPTDRCVNGPLFNSGGALIPLVHAAVAVGIAVGARQELLAMVASGRRQLRAAASMADSPVFHFEFAQADADLAAARAYLRRHAEEVWQLANAEAFSAAKHALAAQEAIIWITNTCVQTVDKFYALGGGAAVYDSSPLQRRLRDIHAAAQHVQAHHRHYEAIGRERVRQALASAGL
jgi:alkylation response protein AidB-like acyl-CoA dehydrogenase